MNNTQLRSSADTSIAALPSGRFAWAVVGVSCVPCLLREGNTKYVPIRIANAEVRPQFKDILKLDAFNWKRVQSLKMTRAESNLLNHINRNHCELIFGEAAFNEKDLIVTLDELMEYYHFLNLTCYMTLPEKPDVFRCGFLRINDDNNSIIPYVIKNYQKYLPIFYFEGEIQGLQAEAIVLDEWDLAYLKLCCIMQGVKKELFAGDECHAISLEQIKLYFTEGTKFEEFWPMKALQSPQSVSDAKVDYSQGSAAPGGTAKTQQSAPLVEVNGNHSRGSAAPEGTAKLQQSTPLVEVNGNHSRRSAAPGSTATVQQSHVEVNSNHSRGPAPEGLSKPQQPTSRVEVRSTFKPQQSSRFGRDYSWVQAPPMGYATAPPSYQASVSGRNHYRNVPPSVLNSQRTSSFPITTNSSSNSTAYQRNPGPNTAMTYSAATPRPRPLMQPMRPRYIHPNNNFNPRQKW